MDGKIFVSSRDKIYCLDENTGNLIRSYEIADPPAIVEGKIFVKSKISVQSYLFSMQERIIEELEEELNESDIWEVFVPDDLKMEFRKNNISLSDYIIEKSREEDGEWEILEYSKHVINGKEMFIEKFILKKEDRKQNIYAKCHTADKIYVLDKDTGNLILSYDLVHDPSSLAVAPGKVFVGTSGNKIYAIDEDIGELIWSYKVGEYFHSIAIANEKVFAEDGEETIYCFGAAKEEKRVQGFEVIFALAVLLVGAYLLRRRK